MVVVQTRSNVGTPNTSEMTEVIVGKVLGIQTIVREDRFSFFKVAKDGKSTITDSIISVNTLLTLAWL